jgi:ABC-2 type transport system permease protein
VVGTAYGLGLLAAGVVLGGRRLDRRSPEVLAQLAHAQM